MSSRRMCHTLRVLLFVVALLQIVTPSGGRKPNKESTDVDVSSDSAWGGGYFISQSTNTKFVARTPFRRNYTIAFAGQCGHYFLVPPNSTYQLSVNFGVHNQDLGDLYCVLTFMALGGAGRKFCVNFTRINLGEAMNIYVFEGENMEFPELYKNIIRHLSKGQSPQIFCTHTNTLSIRFEYPILNGSQSADVEFDVIPTNNVLLMKGNDCFKDFELEDRSYYRVVTWPDENEHCDAWGACILTFVHNTPGTMCVQFSQFYIGLVSTDTNLIFLVADDIPIMSLNMNSSFPNATFCTPTELLFIELRQNISFPDTPRDYNFIFTVTAEPPVAGAQIIKMNSGLLLLWIVSAYLSYQLPNNNS